MNVVRTEWLNENSNRAYPFREDSGMVSTSGFRLPNGAVLDVALSVPQDEYPVEFFMSSFTMAGKTATAVFSVVSTGEAAVSATCVAGDGPEAAYAVGVGRHDGIRGNVVFGELSRLGLELPDGVWRFEASETTLETRCVVPAPPCLGGLYVADAAGGNRSNVLRGDVALVAGSNVRLSVDEDDNAIVISADPDYSYVGKCVCDYDPRECVKTINGISVEDVVIRGDGSCVEVETDTSSGVIKISDNCSKPCCGCAELTFLSEKTNAISTAIGRLESFAHEIEGRLADFTTNALLSQRSAIKYV